MVGKVKPGHQPIRYHGHGFPMLKGGASRCLHGWQVCKFYKNPICGSRHWSSIEGFITQVVFHFQVTGSQYATQCAESIQRSPIWIMIRHRDLFCSPQLLYCELPFCGARFSGINGYNANRRGKFLTTFLGNQLGNQLGLPSAINLAGKS